MKAGRAIDSLELNRVLIVRSFRTFIFLVCNLIIFGISFSYAQTVFITDEFEVTMRTGPSIGNKIIAMVSTGTKLQIIEEEGDWVLVKSPLDREGWILKRYASPEIPKKIVIEQLRNKYRETAKHLEIETEKALIFEKKNKELRNALNAIEKKFEKINKEYNTLVNESKDFLNLKREHTSTIASLRKATAELTKLRKENEQLRLSTGAIWFLSGAAVVTISWLAGFMMGKVRRRSRSLYG